jgi:hypothetical protein
MNSTENLPTHLIDRTPPQGATVRPYIQEPDASKVAPVELHRALYYLIGGLISIVFLFMVARQIDPPSSSLAMEDMARILGRLDGTWVGTEKRLTMTGDLLEHYPSSRKIWSSTTNYQTMTVASERGDQSQGEFWLLRVDEDGALEAREDGLVENSTPAVIYRGRLEDGVIYWSREHERGSTLIRFTQTEGKLTVETIEMSRDANLSSELRVATYQRQTNE